MRNTILKNATIIDCTGAQPRPNGWVAIEDKRIKEIGQGSPGVLPKTAITIDCQGQTLLPGLIECHVHAGSVDASIVEQQRRNFTSTLVIKSLKILNVFSAYRHQDPMRRGEINGQTIGGIAS